MITVVIPALNESANIASVIGFVRKNPNVTQVLVVDDGSIDGTPEIAKAAGATVFTSALLGKGVSMQEGLRAATNEIVLYLDGDMQQLSETLVDDMTRPLLAGEADFVKAKFSRASGRVTTLVGRPLLRVFFPELARFEQPLGGVIAARAAVLQKVKFENDYGVDVALLIDVCLSAARVIEVDIGHVEHNSQPLEKLGDMAAQVVRAILQRAAKYKRLQPGQIEEVNEIDRRMQNEMSFIVNRLGQADKLALLDMDGVLVKGRFAVELARKVGASDRLQQLLDAPIDPDERTRRIASLFEGVAMETFQRVAREIPLHDGAVDLVVGLRKTGYRVGVVTDSYFVASETVRRRVFADFSVGNLLRFTKGRCTGQLTFPAAMSHPNGCRRHPHCKANVLRHLLERLGVDPATVVVVGDNDNDVCLLEAAGKSFAFDPKTDEVRRAAGRVVAALPDVLPLCA